MHHAPEIERIVEKFICAFVQKYLQKFTIKNIICTNPNMIQKE